LFKGLLSLAIDELNSSLRASYSDVVPIKTAGGYATAMSVVFQIIHCYPFQSKYTKQFLISTGIVVTMKISLN